MANPRESLVLIRVSTNAMLSAQPRQERTQTFLVPGWNSRNLVQTGHIWSLCIHFQSYHASNCQSVNLRWYDRNLPKWSAGCQLHLQNWDVRSLLCINSLSLTDTCNFWALLPAFLAGAPHRSAYCEVATQAPNTAQEALSQEASSATSLLASCASALVEKK